MLVDDPSGANVGKHIAGVDDSHYLSGSYVLKQRHLCSRTSIDDPKHPPSHMFFKFSLRTDFDGHQCFQTHVGNLYLLKRICILKPSLLVSNIVAVEMHMNADVEDLFTKL